MGLFIHPFSSCFLLIFLFTFHLFTLLIKPDVGIKEAREMILANPDVLEAR